MNKHDSGGKVRLRLAADVESRAVFGGTRKEYRYLLHRTWMRPGTVKGLDLYESTVDT